MEGIRESDTPIIPYALSLLVPYHYPPEGGERKGKGKISKSPSARRAPSYPPTGRGAPEINPRPRE